MPKSKFRIYNENNELLDEFDSVKDLMKKYEMHTNVLIYKSIKSGEYFYPNGINHSVKYRVEREKPNIVVKKRKYIRKKNNMDYDNKYTIYAVDSKACTITRMTRKEAAKKYGYSVIYISKLMREGKPVAPGVMLIQNWFDTWEYL